MTPPEARLWNVLRAGRLNGWKFARQVPIGPYIADFAARHERLIVEVDGAGHAMTFSHDAARDEYLISLGYTVIRIPAATILTNLDACARTLDHALAQRHPLAGTA